jgi:hypothetical protein
VTLQYGALRRKIGGTYRDFFKDSVEGENSESVVFLLLGFGSMAFLGISKSQLIVCFHLHIFT